MNGWKRGLWAVLATGAAACSDGAGSNTDAGGTDAATDAAADVLPFDAGAANADVGGAVVDAGDAGVPPPPPPRTVQLEAGDLHTCARFEDGSVKCWGYNLYGQLGLGDVANRGDGPGEMGDALPTVALGTGRKAVSISAGAGHTCALLDDGSVKCWGNNYYGQLGLGDRDWRGDGPGEMGDALPAVSLGTGRHAVALEAGGYHNCARLDDGSVKCWGNNNYGRLGLGDTAHRGDGAGEMGDALPALTFGPGRTVVALRAGDIHSCAILDDGTVKCWGANRFGQLGLGDAADRGDDAGEMGNALQAVSLGVGRTALSISAGWFHTCVVTNIGAAKCWGNNQYGQLGLGDMAHRGDASGEMGSSLPSIDVGNGRTPTSVEVAGSHTCALLDNGSVKCWGNGLAGRTGYGDDSSRGDGAGEMGDALPAVSLGAGHTATSVRVGAEHTCVLLDNGAVRCWGRNDEGQLGLGDTNSRGDVPGETGDAVPLVPLWGP